jgi:hypothetical protein
MSDPQSPDATVDGAGAAPVAGAADDLLVLTSALRVPAGPPPGRPAEAPQPDEAALRAIVREILQEELSGQFGERITRGVRKLVRTEVAALLAARDTP